MTSLLRRLKRCPNLRRNIFWDIGIIPAAVLLIVGATLSWVAYDEYWQAQEVEYRLLEAHARNADAQVAGTLNKIARLLGQIAARRIEARPLHGRAFTEILARHHEDFTELGTLLITDAEGRIEYATDPAIVGRTVAQEAYFTAQRRGGQAPALFLSRPDKALLGSMAIVLTLPVRDGNGRFRGIAGVTIDYRFFPNLFQAINPDDSASMTVMFNREGDILFRRADPEKFFGFNIATASVVLREHLAAGTPVTRHIGPSAFNGKTRLFLVRRVGDTGIGLILSRQLDEVLAKWRRDAIFYALIFAFTTVVVGFLAVAAARSKRQVLAGKAFADQLIATANVMVVGLDAAGRVTIFNETAERISGYPRDAVLGADWLELLVAKTDAPRIAALLQQFRDGGTLPHAVEHAIACKSGQERIISWQISIIATPRAAIAFGIDVTERKQIEAERERFVAMVSHEFRTPLATIDGAIQHLEMNAAAVDEASRKRYDKIQKAVDRLTALLDDYLLQEHLGRVRHGLDLERVPTRSLLRDLQASSAALSTEHLVTIEDDNIPDTVLCDADLMRLSLRVLADNAVKYTPPGSKIQISCRRAADQGIEILVRDNGPGIQRDELPRLFNKFFRGRHGAQHSGTGIGLHLARSVVESHGGSLTVRNIPGSGAEFRVWLPE